MQHEPGVADRPAPEFMRLVRRVVGHDQAGLELVGDLTVETVDGLLELDRTVTEVQPGVSPSRGDMQRVEPIDFAVVDVVVGGPCGGAKQ